MLAIWHHVLRQRSDHGFGGWNRRLREHEARPGERLRLLPRLSSLGAAVEALAGSALAPHAAAALLLGAWLARERPAPRGELQRAFRELVAGGRLPRGAERARKLVAAQRGPDEAFSTAHRLLTGCDARLEIRLAEVDRWGVTRFEARALRPRRAGDSVRRLAPYADPQSWRTTQPNTFAQSYHTRVGSPPNPLCDPPPSPQHLGASWQGQLFEHARFQLLPGLEATAFRNTLDIDFVVDERQQEITLEYSLYEALSNRVLGGSPRPGGLDVDSGRGRIRVGPRELVFMAGKDLRFSPAVPLHEELNLLALPFLVTWLSLWLLAAACTRELAG